MKTSEARTATTAHIREAIRLAWRNTFRPIRMRCCRTGSRWVLFE
jgi:hypothetical protein